MLYTPEIKNKIMQIIAQYLININNKGNPDPRNESSVILQVIGNYYLLTLYPQQSQIFIGGVVTSGPLIRAFK